MPILPFQSPSSFSHPPIPFSSLSSHPQPHFHSIPTSLPSLPAPLTRHYPPYPPLFITKLSPPLSIPSPIHSSTFLPHHIHHIPLPLSSQPLVHPHSHPPIPFLQQLSHPPFFLPSPLPKAMCRSEVLRSRPVLRKGEGGPRVGGDDGCGIAIEKRWSGGWIWMLKRKTESKGQRRRDIEVENQEKQK